MIMIIKFKKREEGVEVGGEREGVREGRGGEREEVREVGVMREKVRMDFGFDVVRVSVEVADEKAEVGC